VPHKRNYFTALYGMPSHAIAVLDLQHYGKRK